MDFDVADNVAEVSLRVVLYMISIWLEKQTPFIRHIEEDELWMYRYPVEPSIVPKWALHLILVLVPSIIFLTEYAVYQRPKDIIKGFYALSLVYMLTGIFTVTLKLLVGRPRPNFYMRCFPDGYGTDLTSCTGEYRSHMDGRKSFPSAHTTLSFSGMFFMSLRMCNLLGVMEAGRFKGWKCLLVSIPIVFAILIGASRTCDYHHHYSDVVFGALMGMTMAYCIYYVYYCVEEPPPDQQSTKPIK